MIIILTILLLIIILIFISIQFFKENIKNIREITIPTLLINNSSKYSHYEIIESLIVKYHELLNIKHNCIIYLNIENDSYKNYIMNKYKNINFTKIKNYDFFIEVTFYPFMINKHYKNLKNHIYISHEVNDNTIKKDNIFYLTPLSKKNYIKANILPFSNVKIKTKYPIYVIQGSLINLRRDISLLLQILTDKSLKNLDFKIKILGSEISYEINKYINNGKLIIKKNRNFIDYHKEFSDVYCIITLTSKLKNPQYYTNKLTSSINYADGYNLKCLLDYDLQHIYNLKNVYVYNNKNEFCNMFKKSLLDFYN